MVNRDSIIRLIDVKTGTFESGNTFKTTSENKTALGNEILILTERSHHRDEYENL